MLKEGLEGLAHRGPELLRVAVELRGALKGATQATRPAMLSRRRGGRLIRLGALLLVSPEPVASEVAGVCVMALGLLLRRGDCAGLSDLAQELKALRELRQLLAGWP